jgi:methionyl aminopeptidase
VIQENDVVKIDFGAHVDGYISDNAFTVALDPQYDRLVEASQASTNAAINSLRADVKTNVTGAIVEQTISEFGYKAVRNLSGHLLERYELHAGKSLPSAITGRGDPVKENEVYAVETFATTGSGMVHDRTDQCYIFMLTPKRVPIRSKIARQCLSIINREFKTLPFASRWLTQYMKPTAVNIGLRELSRAGLIHKYHPLADIKGSVISQHEHTVLITKTGTELLT